MFSINYVTDNAIRACVSAICKSHEQHNGCSVDVQFADHLANAIGKHGLWCREYSNDINNKQDVFYIPCSDSWNPTCNHVWTSTYFIVLIAHHNKPPQTLLLYRMPITSTAGRFTNTVVNTYEQLDTLVNYSTRFRDDAICIYSYSFLHPKND